MYAILRLCCLLLVLLLFSTVVGLCEEAPTGLSKPIGHVELSGKTIIEVAGLLASKSGLLLSVENLDPDTSPIFDKVPSSTRHEINLNLDADTSLATALDAAVIQDPRYEWRATAGWLHVMPRVRDKDSVLDRPFKGDLPSEGGIAEQLDQVMGGRFPSGWKHVWVIRYGLKKRPDYGSIPAELTIRDAIDIVLWRYGAYGWFTRPIVDSKGNVIGTCMEILS